MRLLSTIATVSLALAAIASAAPQSVTIQTIAVTTATIGKDLQASSTTAAPSATKDAGAAKASAASENADEWPKNNDQPAGFAGRKFGQWSTSGGRGPRSKAKRASTWSGFKAWLTGEDDASQFEHTQMIRRAPGEIIKGTPVQNMKMPPVETVPIHIETHHYPRGNTVRFSGPSWHGVVVGQQNGGHR